MNRSKKGHSTANGIGIGLIVAIFLVFVGWGTVYSARTVTFVRSATSTGEFTASAHSATTTPTAPTVVHITTPSSVRAVYMSQCAAGTPSFRADLMRLIDTTDLNAIVIDIRDYTGKIAFPTDDPLLKEYVSDACGAKDMKEFVQQLHDKHIYVIGRITTFQNPAYTKAHPEQAVQKVGGGVWKDYKGLAFVDVGAKPYWENVIALSKEAYALGFDELNFDYIRFPSDGPMSQAVYSYDTGKSKSEALESFFVYLHDNLKPTGVVMSADLFGMAATNYDDLGIGQVLERTMPYFDFVDPMVYPSHYPSGFNGYKKVNDHPYDIVQFSLAHAVERAVATTTEIASLAYTRIGTSTPALYAKPAYPASKIRPWLQSFDYPVPYTPAMVAAQIKANTDAGLSSYLFWDPANKYRSLKAVLTSYATVQ